MLISNKVDHEANNAYLNALHEACFKVCFKASRLMK